MAMERAAAPEKRPEREEAVAQTIAAGTGAPVREEVAALAGAVTAGVPVSNRAVARTLQRQKTGYGYEFSDDPLTAGGFGPNDAAIRVRPGPVRTTLIRPRKPQLPGDAVRPDVEKLLNEFKAAGTADQKSKLAMQAVGAVIAAYGLSTRGVASMRYDPKLTEHAAETSSVGDKGRRSRIDFGPDTFDGGFEWLVHTVAHELEHVRQELIGGYDHSEYIAGDWPGLQHPLREFLAYAGEVLEVGTTEGPGGRGLLGAMRSADVTVSLPPLPPDKLALTASSALARWRKMKVAQRQRAWEKFVGVRDKLLDRLRSEAPGPIRPPADRSSPAFTKWRAGSPPSDDPFSPEYQDWVDAGKSPWTKVIDQWKLFDAEGKP